MKLEELVNQYYDDLNENDLMIFKYILAHKNECCDISIEDLSKNAVSQEQQSQDLPKSYLLMDLENLKCI